MNRRRVCCQRSYRSSGGAHSFAHTSAHSVAHAHARTRGGFGAGAEAGALDHQDLRTWLANTAGFKLELAREFARGSRRELERGSRRELECKRGFECRSR
ncbi:MAG: hypothetical protein ACTTIC_02945 [Helicobacteraceae bacterium]